jgi:hypothetical protein
MVQVEAAATAGKQDVFMCVGDNLWRARRTTHLQKLSALGSGGGPTLAVEPKLKGGWPWLRGLGCRRCAETGGGVAEAG